jgi:hypothetical protein
MLNKAAVEVDLQQGVAEAVARGIIAAELAARTNHYTCSISPHRLQRWLLANDFAVLVGGRLVPTALGIQVGTALA